MTTLDASELSLLSELNGVVLEEGELARVLAAAKQASYEGEADDMTGIMTTVQLYDNDPDKAKAIIFRLQALARVIAESDLDDWILGDRTGVIPAFTIGALLSAAADHPLCLEKGEVSFERQSFLSRALERAQPQGRDIS
ncbi:MAG: hypothetical protein GXX84_05930 [Acidobacteria bacterium]|nr:hypothetical protein [Acidobacteriota bacterium]